MVQNGQRTLASTLFHLLPEGVWDRLRDRMHERVYQPGDVLVQQGALDPDFHVIVEGVVSVEATAVGGERRELGRLGFGECLGEMSLLTGEPASADVVALTATRTYAASQAQLGGFGELRAQLIEALSLILASRLRQANDRLLAKHAANQHMICCAPEDAAALASLPDAIASTTAQPTVALFLGPEYQDAAAAFRARHARIEHVEAPGPGGLHSLLAQLGNAYEQVIVIGREGAMHELAHESASVLHVVRGNKTALEPSGHATHGQVIAIVDEPWTVPSLRRLSDVAGRPVVAAIAPSDGAFDAGGGIARLARLMTGRRVGLALGAGAAKGLAHLGVLRAMEEMRLPIDIVSGCSIGAAVGAGVAARIPVDELTSTVSRIAARAVRPTLPLHSFLSNAGVKHEMKQIMGDRRIEDLDLPFAIVAVDLFRRSEVTFTSGTLWPRTLASISIPGVYPTVRGAGSYFVDGGVLSPVPVRQARDLGAGVVIGVRLTATRTSPRERLDVRPRRPFAIETMIRAFEIMQNRISEVSHEHADVNLEIVVDGTGGIRDFQRVDEFGAVGYRAAMDALPSIQRVIPYVRAAS